MRIFLFIVIYSFCFRNGNAQNLVPNPSFEDNFNCPSGLDDVNVLMNWFSARPSPDYFNICSTNIDSSVPLNYWGYQFPANGNSYIGLVTFYGGFNTREFVGVQLITPLNKDSTYYISFKAVLGLENSTVKCATDNLGLFFSNAYYDGINDTLQVYNQANIFSTQIITDTLNWVTLSFTFKPDSNYTYMYIGNFFEDSQTNIIQYGPSCAAYYYLDDLCISIDSTFCPNGNVNLNEIEYSNNLIQLFPNPDKNHFTLNFILENNLNNISVQIYNSDLKLVYVNNEFTGFKIDVNCETWSSGAYIIKILYNQRNFSKLFIKP